MSYFEYVMIGDLTPVFEEKTSFILSQINEGVALYRIDKYTDEVVAEDKKKRTLILTSAVNVWNVLYPIFKDTNIITLGFFKQRII
jgi:hypothetical protein